MTLWFDHGGPVRELAGVIALAVKNLFTRDDWSPAQWTAAFALCFLLVMVSTIAFSVWRERAKER